LCTRARRCREGELLWIDITAPDEDDYQLLQERFHLHPDGDRRFEGARRSALSCMTTAITFTSFSMRSVWKRLRRWEEASPASTRDALCLDEIDCLIGPDYVVTLHAEPVAPFIDLRERWRRRPELMQSGAGYLLSMS
jgi:Mg2+ and Co2+ transporter CorA